MSQDRSRNAPIRAVGPNDIDHVEVWGGISKETRQPIYGVDYVFGDGSTANVATTPDLKLAMSAARECSEGGAYPIRDGKP